MKIGIVGQGYVGLPLALAFVNAGYTVVGFDIDEKKIESLSKGVSHVDDISALSLESTLATGRYVPTAAKDALKSVDVAIICVPTPLGTNGEPDLSFLESASDLLGRALNSTTLIINESTSYPGTLRKLIFNRVNLASERKVEHLFAVAPERVDPGNKNFTIKNTPRIISVLTQKSIELAHKLYSDICDEVIKVNSPEIAESAKLFENTFRQVNIALVNEFAMIMNKMGIPVREVIKAAESKPYGFMSFTPGIGVGGHCIPVDPTYLSYAALESGTQAKFIQLANEINREMPALIVNYLQNRIQDCLENKRILIVGIAYKANVADVRESPSIEILKELRHRGAIVSWNDSVVNSWQNELSHEIKKGEFDVALILVNHSNLNVQKVISSATLVLDTTGTLLEIEQLI